MTLTLRLTALAAAALAAGCATPEPLVRLESAGSHATWIAGRSVEVQERNGVRVAAAFDHQDASQVVFRVEVQNDSRGTIDVGPDAMTCRRFEDGVWSTETLVIDPEEVIAEIDARSSRERARAENDERLFPPLLFLSVLGDIATVASGNVDRTTGLQTAAIANESENRSARHANAVQQLGSTKEVWMNAALRRTTIAPGQAVAGLVYINVRKKARLVRLDVWAGSLPFQFLFKQYVRPV